jgi:hypothetical protein
VGFSALGSTDTFQPFNNHGLSRTSDVGMVACNNTGFNRPWTNLITRIGVSVTRDQLDRSTCQKRVAQDQEIFPVDFRLFFAARPCPCSLFQAFRDRRYFIIEGVPGRVIFIQRFVDNSSNGFYFTSRCSYDLRYVNKLIGSTEWKYFLRLLPESFLLINLVR